MSKYTTQLRYLIENNYDFGLNEYPIYDEEYRPILNKKILDHYKFREIGFETVAMFKHYLKTKMNEIMPYYNKLYESTLIEFNPLYNNKISEQTRTVAEQTNNSNGSVSTESETNVNNDSSNMNIEQDTPQGRFSLSDIDDDSDSISASKVIRNKNIDSDSSTGSATTTNENESIMNSENSYFRELVGNTENPSEMIKKYRETFLNIDMMIIDELSELFFGLY